jgi:hypothetical protein
MRANKQPPHIEDWCMVSHQMHLIEFREIVRGAEVAHAISPVVYGHRLTEEETEQEKNDLIDYLKSI